MTTTALLVMAGAALGAPARWAVDRAVQSRVGSVFPWGTLVVNVTGSFLLGAVLGLVPVVPVPVQAAAFVGTGVLGAFTTYSTFAYETVRLAETGGRLVAGANVALSLVAGTGAGLGGWLLVTVAASAVGG